MSSSDSVSIKELASKLKTSDALIKKIIKDFEIENEDSNNIPIVKGFNKLSFQAQPSDKILIFTQYNSIINLIEEFLLDFFFSGKTPLKKS